VAPPLDIIGMPGYDKLNDDEKKVREITMIELLVDLGLFSTFE
jgi:hypothetical protein